MNSNSSESIFPLSDETVENGGSSSLREGGGEGAGLLLLLTLLVLLRRVSTASRFPYHQHASGGEGGGDLLLLPALLVLLPQPLELLAVPRLGPLLLLTPAWRVGDAIL